MFWRQPDYYSRGCPDDYTTCFQWVDGYSRGKSKQTWWLSSLTLSRGYFTFSVAKMLICSYTYTPHPKFHIPNMDQIFETGDIIKILLNIIVAIRVEVPECNCFLSLEKMIPVLNNEFLLEGGDYPPSGFCKNIVIWTSWLFVGYPILRLTVEWWTCPLSLCKWGRSWQKALKQTIIQ